MPSWWYGRFWRRFLGDNILYWKRPAVFLTHPVHQTPWSKLLLLKYPGAQGYLIIVSAYPVRRKGSPHMSRFRLHLRLALAFLIYVISFAFWIRTFLQWTYNSRYLMPESVRHVVFRINGRDSKMFWGFGLVWFAYRWCSPFEHELTFHVQWHDGEMAIERNDMHRRDNTRHLWTPPHYPVTSRETLNNACLIGLYQR